MVAKVEIAHIIISLVHELTRKLINDFILIQSQLCKFYIFRL